MKTGRPVLEVLQEKHPKMREPNLNDLTLKIFKEYPTIPQVVPLDITAETVEKVASHLSGAAGPSGTDAVDLSNWLLHHGAESQLLCTELAAMARWLANDHPHGRPTGPSWPAALSHLTRNQGHGPLALAKFIANCSRNVSLRSVAVRPPLPVATSTSALVSRPASREPITQ
jgi:hypothetical protein